MLTYRVLFSFEQRLRKIVDFGISTEGISKRYHTTRYSRGTSWYHAPELSNESPGIITEPIFGPLAASYMKRSA